MGLNRQHQLQLIKDILTDHQLDCCGTVAEYEQVGRVIQLMLAKKIWMLTFVSYYPIFMITAKRYLCQFN